MKPWPLLLAGALATAGGAMLLPPSSPPPAEPPAVSATGIGPLQLGRPLRAAARLALPLDAAAAQVGPGCDARDQVTISLNTADAELAVMAMAGADGNIEEIVALPRAAAPSTANAAACRDEGAGYARRFAAGLGDAVGESLERKPATDEFRLHFSGGAAVVARWFPGGGSCDLALVFKPRPAS